MKRAILVGLSDTHAGHSLALCNPETILEDDSLGEIVKYRPRLNETQKYLWNCYQEDIEQVRNLAGKDKIIVIHHGDITQGNRYPVEWVSTRESDQFIIATWNMRPWLEIPNVISVRLAKGTKSHEFGEGSSTLIVQNHLKSLYPKRDIRATYHGYCEIAGITVDYAHHGPSPGVRNWLRGNEARYYLRSLMQDEIDRGDDPPDLVLRGHYHTWVREFLEKSNGHKTFESWIVLTPSYSLAGDYARQAAKSPAYVTNGLCAVEIIDGHIYRIHKMARTIDIRTKEKLL